MSLNLPCNRESDHAILQKKCPTDPSGISIRLWEYDFRSYPDCPVLVCDAICQYCQRKLDILACDAGQINIDIL